MADNQFYYFSGDGLKTAMTGYVNGALQTTQDPTQGGRFTYVDGGGNEGGLIGKLRDAASDPKYGAMVVSGAQTLIADKQVVHGTTEPYTYHYAEKYSYSDTTSTTLSATESLKVGLKESMSISEKVEVVDVEESIELSVEVTLSATESKTWSESKSHEFDASSDFQVESGKTLIVTTTYTQSEIDVPYVQNYYLGGKLPTLAVPAGDSAIATNYHDWIPYPGGDPNDKHETWFFNPDVAGYYINLWNTAGPEESKKWSAGPVQDGNVDAAVSVYAVAATLKGGFGARFEVTPTYQATQASVASGPDHLPTAENDQLLYGLNVEMDHAGDITLTNKADDVRGSMGADVINVAGGFDRVHGRAGDDVIIARDTGAESATKSGAKGDLLIGGAGDDVIILEAEGGGNIVKGGSGDDLIQVFARSTFISGGRGADTFELTAKSVGSHIADHCGANTMKIDAGLCGDQIVFIRQGDALFVSLDGARETDPNEQVVWSDFFAGENRVTVTDNEGRHHALLASAFGEPDYGVLSEVVDQLIYA